MADSVDEWQKGNGFDKEIVSTRNGEYIYMEFITHSIYS